MANPVGPLDRCELSHYRILMDNLLLQYKKEKLGEFLQKFGNNSIANLETSNELIEESKKIAEICNVAMQKAKEKANKPQFSKVAGEKKITQNQLQHRISRNLPLIVKNIQNLAMYTQKCHDYVTRCSFLSKTPDKTGQARMLARIMNIAILAICVVGGIFAVYIAASSIAGPLGISTTILSGFVGGVMGLIAAIYFIKFNDYFIHSLISDLARSYMQCMDFELYLRGNNSSACAALKAIPDSLFQSTGI